MTRHRSPLAILVVLAALAAATNLGSASAAVAPPAPPAAFEGAASGNLVVRRAPETGAVSWLRRSDGGVVWRDGGAGRPGSRALAFLDRFGSALGFDDTSALRVDRVVTDLAGRTHVRLDQLHEGLEVFGAELVVHLDAQGVTGVNGYIVPDVAVDVRPRVTERDAVRTALRLAAAEGAPSAGDVRLAVYREGLIEGRPGATRLAWAVDVEGVDVPVQVWVDAADGSVLNRVPLVAHAKDRVVHTPDHDPDNPDLFVVRTEDGPPNPVPPVDNLFRFTGQTYDLFHDAFGFDWGEAFAAHIGSDAASEKMRTVYLINEVCPNAYWDGRTTNYCPGFDLDDVVGHEWGHGFTDLTHDLIYQCQSGALNESYSDIWGEIVDLLNGEDGLGGANNDAPWPQGQRWLVGEDLTERVHRIVLRDMWDPVRLGDPDKVSSLNYACGEFDHEGVHQNSGVPNHAFAILTDGKSFNGLDVEGIGLTKTAHLYWQAMSAYQTPTSKFTDHEQALRAACQDLAGVDLNDLETGRPSGEVIADDDCHQLALAMAAVEMSVPPVRCRYTPTLEGGAPEVCEGAETAFADDFESGLDAWTTGGEGSAASDTWPGYSWSAATGLPGGRAGSAAFAVNAAEGNCRRGPDVSGRFWMDTPAITVPEHGATLRFDHYFATWKYDDGGNVLVSVNGGDFEVLPQEAYLHNAPNGMLTRVEDDPLSYTSRTNPKRGQMTWTGTDRGSAAGSWGTTVASLDAVAAPGDSVVVRFELGVNCSGGIDGWYVDDVAVYACPEAVEP